MSGVWHPSIDAYEIYGSRQENWNDTNPFVTVMVQTSSYTLATFVQNLVDYKYDWPENTTAPLYLYATNVEVMPVQNRLFNSAGGSEIIEREDQALVRITYTPLRQFLRTVDTTVGTGTGTGSGYQTQSVWVEYSRAASTEFLTLDYNDFAWPKQGVTGYQSDHTLFDPLKPDEAPGRVMRTVKYVSLFHNIYITEDLEDIINNYSGTVNSGALSSIQSGVLWTFKEDQVLFNVEDVTPTVRKVVGSLHPSAVLQLCDLRVSFNCRIGESTWNKFWRCRQDTTGTGSTANDAGWYQMYLKPQSQSNSYYNVFEPFVATNYWSCLWV